MSRRVTSEDAVRFARQLLASGFADDPLARDRGRLLDALAVRAPSGDQAGWVVPVELGGALLGFVQLEVDGTFRRYASFHGTTATALGCPPAADWLDHGVIEKRARRVVGADVRLEAPVLTYDRNPDRLAWALRATPAEGGRSIIVFVAGTEAWRADTTSADE